MNRIEEKDLIELGFEWDADHFAHSLLVSKSSDDTLIKSETYVVLGNRGKVNIHKKWDALEEDVIYIGKLDLNDLKELVKILKRAIQ